MSTDLRTVASLVDPVTTYQESVADICATLHDLVPEQWDSITPCPGWTVADIAAHIVDIDSMAMGVAKPNHTPNWDALPHVTSASHQFTELGVDYRRGTSPDVLQTQLMEVSEKLLEHLKQQPQIIKLPWSKNEISQDQFMSLRSFDIWIHEQDIRSAVNSPGDLATNPARSAAQRMINALPLIWGKKVGAPPGSEILFTLTGPRIEGSVRIAVNPEGHAEFVEQVSESADQVSMSWPDFVNAFAGRVPISETLAASQIHGKLAELFTTQLASTP